MQYPFANSPRLREHLVNNLADAFGWPAESARFRAWCRADTPSGFYAGLPAPANHLDAETKQTLALLDSRLPNPAAMHLTLSLRLRTVLPRDFQSAGAGEISPAQQLLQTMKQAGWSNDLDGTDIDVWLRTRVSRSPAGAGANPVFDLLASEAQLQLSEDIRLAHRRLMAPASLAAATAAPAARRSARP